jgi:acyl dehydratase
MLGRRIEEHFLTHSIRSTLTISKLAKDIIGIENCRFMSPMNINTTLLGKILANYI